MTRVQWAMAGLAGALLAGGLAGPAEADEGDGQRRFTASPTDTNRSYRMVYVPVFSSYPGVRPATQPHDAASAAWFQLPLGATQSKPSQIRTKDGYLMESFDRVRTAGEGEMLRVVVTRTPGPPAGAGLPQIGVVHPESQISARAFPAAEAIPGGVRYTFMVRPPHYGFITDPAASTGPSLRYEVRFLPAEEVRPPSILTRAPGFGGPSIQERLSEGPPRIPTMERVAGRRQEYRKW